MICLAQNFVVNSKTMEKEKEKGKVFQIVCPCCSSLLWVDALREEVIQSEKRGAKKKDSLNELLLKEKKRKEGFERKFEATAELEKKKLEKAKEKFKKVLQDLDKGD